jgi:GT2 family glycosyltransferase
MLHDTAATLGCEVRAASPRAVRLRLAVGIATAGRPVILAQMLRRLRLQTRAPDLVVVCAPTATDAEGAADASPGVVVLTGPRGLPRQRNAILRHLAGYDVVVFFDDDFIAADDYLAGVEQIMLSNPGVVMTTGRILGDGILGPGLTFEAADAALHGVIAPAPAPLDDVANGYGCNMSVRLDPARTHALTFDERLPLYGWLEDVDFGQQLVRHGRVVRTDATQGVHLGIKMGRQPGLKLGYSQVANPLYLMRKGTMGRARGLALMSRNIAMNMVRSFSPEPWVDRRGRLRGNGRALLDLAFGRLDPARIESF